MLEIFGHNIDTPYFERPLVTCLPTSAQYQQSLISPKLLKGENGSSTLFPLSTIILFPQFKLFFK